MANQPKKYTKFVAAAATATLVASAIVPVASAAGFSDVADTNSHAVNINALAEAGIIGGYPDGTFKPNQELTRGQVVKMLGKWVEAQGFEIPADYATKARFTDLAADAKDQELVKYAALVFDTGVFAGSNGALNAGGKITRENMALVLDRAFKAINDTTLVEVAAEIEDITVADLNTAKSEAREAIQALRNLGISGVENFMPKNSVTRAQFATFLNKTIQTEAAAELTVTSAVATSATTLDVVLSDESKHVVTLDKALEANKETEVTFTINEKEYTAKVTYTVALESVNAINAKTIEVKFNTAVDSSKATVELLRGTFKQNVTLTWAEDKKSVQLTGATNFQPADYTVNVSGLTTEALTGSVKIEAQKVASIEILDEVAVVDKAVKTDGTFPTDTTATVTYVVKDQYGTDITKSTTTSLTTNDSDTIELDPKNGVVKIKGAAVNGKKVGDLVPVVLVDTNSGISTTKTVKLSAESAVSSIAVSGVFNKKGEAVALNDASKANEAFIVLDLKDQYGKEIKDVEKAKGLVITNTNETNLVINNKVTTKEINGVEKLVIELKDIKKAGNTDILLISTTNGQSAKYTVAVAETSVSDAITVSQPEIAVANEATLIPVTVTDKQGNVITDKKLLASATKGIKVTGEEITEASFEVKDGQVFFKKNFTTEGKQALVFQTANYKVATVTVDVKAEAKPAVVRGTKNPLVISTAQGKLAIDTKKHLVIEDQYGRVIKDSDAAVTVSLADEKTEVISLSGKEITALKNGTTKVVIELSTELDKIDSAVEVPVQVTDGKEYDGYEIKTIGKKQVGEVDFTVNGLLNNGKVALETSEYTATIEGGKITTPTAVTGGSYKFEEKDLNTKSASETDTKVDTEFTLKVTINATGKVLEQKFVVSPEAPKVTEFFFTTSDSADYELAKAITEAVLESGTVATKLVSGEKTVKVAALDQYGKGTVDAIPADATITIVPTKASEVTIEKNGTADATVALVEGVEESVVTLKVTIDGVTKELKVNLVPAEVKESSDASEDEVSDTTVPTPGE